MFRFVLTRARSTSSSSSEYISNGLETAGKQGAFKIYAPLLQWCGNAKAADEGRRVHNHLVLHGYGSNTFLGNCLIQMYRKCGLLEDARSAFESMPNKDIVSWNAMISGYAQNGHSKSALDLYQKMVSEGVEPNRITFIGVLGACGNLRDLSQGMKIHSLIRASRRELDTVVETALLTMYAKCGDVKQARDIFESMPRKNVISWTAMLTAYAQTGHVHEAVEIYHLMGREGVEPNRITFISALTAFSSLGDLEMGRRIHESIATMKMPLDGPLGNALITMYSRCGRVEQARKIFDEMTSRQRDVVSWTSMITAYTQNSKAGEALELYKSMDMVPNTITYMALLSACSVLGSLEEGRLLHSRIASSTVSRDAALETALITMYGNCGSPEEARSVFDKMTNRNIMSWNSMIGAYANFGAGDEALMLYRRMELEGIGADVITLIGVLGSCARLGALIEGIVIHRRAESMNLFPDNVLETALINMYAKCHRLRDARHVFNAITHNDVVSWTAIIAAYVQEGSHYEALELYRRMEREKMVQPNSVTYVAVLGACSSPAALETGREIHRRIQNMKAITDLELLENALLNMYCKCGSLDEARKIFETMSRRVTVSWNTILMGYVQAGQGLETIHLYKRMQLEENAVVPDETTLVTVLSACASAGDFRQGKEFYHSTPLRRTNNIFLENAVVNLHAKCGFLDAGREMFENMVEKNLVTWTAMIVGYAQHGHGDEAIEMYRRMQHQGVERPDVITFTTIFIGCSHSGLVHYGRECFLSMTGEWGIAPLFDHYVCMVDVLGRAGWLNEAEELIHSMPFEAEAVAWMSLLGSCRIHRDLERAKKVEEVLMKINPDETGSHVLLSNIYVQGQ